MLCKEFFCPKARKFQKITFLAIYDDDYTFPYLITQMNLLIFWEKLFWPFFGCSKVVEACITNFSKGYLRLVTVEMKEIKAM